MPQRSVLGMHHAMPPELGKREVSSISVTSRSPRMVAFPWGEAACLQASLEGKRNPGDRAQWFYCWLSSQAAHHSMEMNHATPWQSIPPQVVGVPPVDGNGLPGFPAALPLKPKADNCHVFFSISGFWSHKGLGESPDLPLKLLELFVAFSEGAGNVAGVGGCRCGGPPIPSSVVRNCPIAPIEAQSSQKYTFPTNPGKRGGG